MSPTRSTLLLGALALAFAAAAQDRGKLLGVKAAGDAKASVVVIYADRPLSFTTMKLSDPPRVVVDFADTEIASARRELTVEDGTVRRVALAAAGSRTARVVVELQADAEFDVRTAKHPVHLRISRIRPLVAEESVSPPAPPEEAAPAAGPPQQPAAAPNPPEHAAAPPPAPGEQAAAPPAAPGEQAAAPKPATPAPAPPPPPKTQTQTRTEPPVEPEKTPPAASSKTSPAEAAKIASLPKVSLVGSAPAASPPPAAKPGRARANITGLGFRPVGAGEVIVRSDHPLAYGVTAGTRSVLLHLPGARIPLPNNRRPLDTRFFDGAVERIVPVSVAGGTDVRIELREPAEYRLEQSGPVLTVTFSSPR